MHRLIPLIVFLATVLGSAVALACDPASDYWVVIEESDAPACLDVEDAGHHDGGAVFVSNNCEDAARIEGLDCDNCDDPLEIEPGDREDFIVGFTGSQTLGWSVADEEGTFTTRVEHEDKPARCPDTDSACTIAVPARAASGAPLVLLVGLAALAIRLGGRRARA